MKNQTTIKRICQKWIISVFFFILISTSLFGQHKYSLADTTIARSILVKSDSLLKARQFEKALELAQEADTIYINTTGSIHDHRVEVWDHIGKLYYFWQKPDKSVKAFNNALNIYEKIYGKNNPDGIELYNNLGVVYTSLSNFEKSLKYAKKALELQLIVSKGEDLGIATRYYRIGTTYQYMQKNDLAFEYHNKAFIIRKKIDGDNGLHTAYSMRALGTIALEIGKPALAIEYLQQVLPIYEKNYGRDYPDLIGCNNDIAQSYKALGAFDKANKIHFENLEVLINKYGPKHSSVATTYNNIGNTFLAQGKLHKAVEFFEKAINAFPKDLGNHPVLGKFYGNIGVAYSYLGDVAKGISCQELSLKIRKEKLGKNHIEIAFPLHNLAIEYSNAGDFEKAIEYHNQAIEIQIASLGKNHPNTITMYDGLANTYSSLKNYEKSIEYHKKALAIIEELSDENKIFAASPLNNLATDYLWLEKYDTAIIFYNKALNLKYQIYGSQHPSIANSCYNLARTHELKNNFSEAEKNYNKAFEALGFQKGRKSLESVNSIPEFINTSRKAGNFYNNRYLKTNKKNNLYNAKEMFNYSIEAIEFLNKGINKDSKISLANKAKLTYSYALSSNFLLYNLTDSLYYLTESFSLSERSKAFLLYGAMQETDALKIAGIPDSLLEKEYDLRIDITYFDKKRQKEISAGLNETDTIVLQISGKLFDLNREYETLKERFENDYPQYYKAKYDLSTISLEEVQKELLQPNQSLLEYMVGDSSIFLFLIQKNNYEVHEIKYDFPLEDWVREMTKDGIYGYYALADYNPLKTKGRRDSCDFNYTQAAQKLYEKLIAPVADRLTENLIIIPDGVLGYVPFEALLSGTPPRIGAFKAYPFLIKKHLISYCYSATLLQEMQQKQHQKQPSHQLLAMAPFFQGNVNELAARIDTMEILAIFSLRDSLNALNGSGEEVAAVSKIWRGEAVYGTEASLFEFQQNASDYRILHLSTHGKADDRVGDYAYLAFAMPNDKGVFDKLYARDLYNYALNADMVVLSACETGIGKLQKGEGIISLARAFAYAGAKSIFPTLWQVSDEKTKDLFIDFYTYLKKGKSKDEALRLAKLDFLKDNAGSGLGTHPFFWAGLIGIGDMEPLRD